MIEYLKTYRPPIGFSIGFLKLSDDWEIYEHDFHQDRFSVAHWHPYPHNIDAEVYINNLI